MNTPQILELAIRATLAQFAANAVPVSWLHCAFTPTDATNESGAVAFPQMVIQVGGKAQASEGTTWDSAVTIICASLSEDDPRGDQRAAMYEAAEDIFEHLIPRDKQDFDEVAQYFAAQVRQSIPTFCLGGFSPDASDGATVTDGLYLATFSGVLHYEY